MRQLIDDRRFAFGNLILVLVGGAISMLKPELGLWSLLIALFPWMLRLVAGVLPFQRTRFDWLVGIFLITAWVGYWAAYDKSAAWSKIWLVVMAVLLYYAVSAQPKENLDWISYLLFGMGVGVAVYFYLTQDFVNLPRKFEFVNRIGRWVMGIRPQVGWRPMHPNYVSGMIAITIPFIFYPAWRLIKSVRRFTVFFYAIILFGLGVSFSALVMATSRGVVMAIVSAGGVWLLWRVTHLDGIKSRLKSEAVFPSLVLIYLSLVVVFLYTGPARSVSAISGQDNYGTGSRLELFTRSLYFLAVFPITGGGLGSFPGLYSHYMLGIPFFYLPNSHNLFLDVAIEQGVLGGLAFLFVFIGSVWFVSRAIVMERSPELQLFNWLVLCTLVIAFVHGMVDNYLYNGCGTFLVLLLAGLSTLVKHRPTQVSYRKNPWTVSFVSLALIGVFIFNSDKLRAVWYANLGGVQMSQAELVNFPSNKWTGSEILPKLEKADVSLHSALQLDPENQTANYFLGLISMLRIDFESASKYLKAAHKYMPYNRGIIKSLGYCYVWLGDVDKAMPLLVQIPEVNDELGVYVWWWGARGREDLSVKASAMIFEMGSPTIQPLNR